MGKVIGLFLTIAAICSAPALQAGTITFDITLDGTLQQVPPNASTGTGTATVVIDDVANAVSVNLAYSGLLAPATNAHIHCCNGPGVNSPVVIPFIPAGFVTGATSGTFSAVFNGVSPALIASLENYSGYINIHTSLFPGGEIRGDLTPEPGTLVLLGLGLAGLGVWRRRRTA